MHFRRVALFVATLLLCAPTARADPGVKLHLLRDLPLYEALFAEPRAARIMMVAPAWSKQFPHSVESGARFTWQIALGKELPILAVATSEIGKALTDGQWGVGLWLPVSFHMIEDFKDSSSPIVDMDYRFGLMLKGQYALQLGKRTFRLGVRLVPWAHESTHLGDEYTTYAAQKPGFELVNVGYEYREYGISMEGEDVLAKGHQFVIRTGGISPWNDGGYYYTRLLSGVKDVLTPSLLNFEPSAGLEYRFPGFLDRDLYVSVDARHKLVYAYHQTAQNQERQQWSWSGQLGSSVKQGAPGVPIKQAFVQLYYGVNPYGQLRSQADYWSMGLGVVFGQ